MVILLALACASARGAEVLLESIADTTLIETEPDANLGGQIFFNAGAAALAGTPANRGLIRFDLGPLPTNAIVTAANLILHVTGEPSGGGPSSTFRVHRVLKPWSEGTKAPDDSPGLGLPASAGETTWRNRFHPDQPWSSPGGGFGNDYSAEVRAEQFVYGVGDSPYFFPANARFLADIQEWLVSPSSNFGIVISSDAENTAKTARRFGSRENAGNAPQLEVFYMLPPELRIALEGSQATLAFQAEAQTAYELQATSSLTAPDWTTEILVASGQRRMVSHAVSTSDTARYFRIRVDQSGD